MGLSIVLYERKYIDSFRAGSYSTFGKFRSLLAQSVNMVLEDQTGFGGGRKWTGEETYYELLNHSDCEGSLIHGECEQLVEDFTPENREAFSNTVIDNGESPVYLDKWDKWEEVIEKCAESENYRIEFH